VKKKLDKSLEHVLLQVERRRKTVYEQKISQEINSKTEKAENGEFLSTLHVSVNTHPDHIIVPLVFEREEVFVETRPYFPPWLGGSDSRRGDWWDLRWENTTLG